MKNAEILVIEDKNSAKVSIKSKLKCLGYTVLAIEPYKLKTIKNSRKVKPDLILIDVVTGGDCIKSALREQFDIPCICLIDQSQQIFKKINLNPKDYIIKKPVNDDELKKTIETALYSNFKSKGNIKNSNVFLSSVNEPAFLIDLEGNILFTNEYTTKILGNVIDSNIYELLPHDIASCRKKYVQHAIKTKEITIFEDERCKRNYQYRIYPILNEKKEVSKLSIIGLDNTEHKIAENERRLTVEFLSLVNKSNGTEDLVNKAITFFKQQSGCEAVGIRLKKGEDYPYFEARGFPEEFILAENKLCACDHMGNAILDQEYNPVMECMCGNVICGRFDDSKPFFTAHGSFWTNSTTKLLASTSKMGRTRNRCNGEGYESVALIPLYINKQRLGLLQLNDSRKGLFSPGIIDLWEQMADQLAIALAKFCAEDALLESEEKFRMIFNSSPDYTILIGQNGNLIDVNEAAQKVVGLSREELIGKNFTELDLLLDKEMPSHLENASRILMGYNVKPHESKIIDKDSKIRYVETYLTPLKKDNEIYAFNVISHDISERKKSEEKIKASLKEKEVLLREIHHRVKNNLQIISSLLSLQKSYIKDNETLDVLEESQNRVKSMAIVHEKLYNSENLVKICFKDYIKDLANSLFLTYRCSKRIKLTKNIDNIFFDVNTAIPCGLIINELITNSLKHAFPGSSNSTAKNHRNKEINLKLNKINNNFILIVSDNGVGLPENVNFKNTGSLGLRLVNSLVKQLEGTIELDKSEGTNFQITFKELKYKKRI